jgi:hypothetical protein
VNRGRERGREREGEREKGRIWILWVAGSIY